MKQLVTFFVQVLCCYYFSLDTVCCTQRPNIVLFVADDLGWGDIGLHGSKEVQTPNIDLLAANGIHLTNYYVSPICSPSRSALLTGRHPIHTGMQHGVIAAPQPYGLPLEYSTLPQFLSDLGYRSHLVGKWHQGFYKKDYWPTRRGFHTHFGYLGGKEDYFDHSEDDQYWGFDFWDNDTPVAGQYLGQYSTKLYADKSKQIIRSYQNSSTPFLLINTFQAVHAGNNYCVLQVPQCYIDKFSYIKDLRRRKFAGMVFALDEAIGDIFNELHNSQLLNNTIVLFTSDNGGATGGDDFKVDNSVGSNWPLRGVKYTLWEGGIRAVGFIWSPLLSKMRYNYGNLMHIQDWLPTLYAAAGGNVNNLPTSLDGVNHWPALNGNQGQSPREEVLHNIDDIWGVSALRYKNYKIVQGTVFGGKLDGWFKPLTAYNSSVFFEVFLPSVRSTLKIYKGVVSTVQPYEVDCGPMPSNASENCKPTEEACLYDIGRDPCEYNNIAQQHPQTKRFLLDRIGHYRKSYRTPVNKPSDPNSNPLLHDYYWRNWQTSNSLKM